MNAADNVVNGTLFSCDVGRFNEDVFVYIAPLEYLQMWRTRRISR